MVRDWEYKEFLRRLRKVCNHLTATDHVRLHHLIERAAYGAFGEVDDFEIEDWLDNETTFRRMRGRNFIEWDDYRFDADRTMFSVLLKLVDECRLMDNLQAFRMELEPQLKGFSLSPDFTIRTLSLMPRDAAHLLHVTLGKRLEEVCDLYTEAKVFRKGQIMSYVCAMRHMDWHYDNYGMNLMDRGVSRCHVLLQGLYANLDIYMSGICVALSNRFQLASVLHRGIPRLIASL